MSQKEKAEGVLSWKPRDMLLSHYSVQRGPRIYHWIYRYVGHGCPQGKHFVGVVGDSTC